jgi:hypothetical protein
VAGLQLDGRRKCRCASHELLVPKALGAVQGIAHRSCGFFLEAGGSAYVIEGFIHKVIVGVVGAVAHTVRIYDSVHHASGVGVVLKDMVPIATMVSCTYLIMGDEGLKPAASHARMFERTAA